MNGKVMKVVHASIFNDKFKDTESSIHILGKANHFLRL
jgi:hypothetical protein